MLIWFPKPFLRPPDRSRRVRDPNGTIWTTFGAGRARKFFRSGVPGVPKKIFPPRIYFVQKRYSLGPGWVLGPKNSFWTPLDPPQGAILAHFTHKMAKMGFKNGQKMHFFHKKNFCSESFYFGSYLVWDPQKPEISLLDPPMDPILAHFVCKKGRFWGQKSHFSQICIFVQNDFSEVRGSVFIGF